MDNKFNAVKAYRAEVSFLIHQLLMPRGGFNITKIAEELHITIGQCSRVYHGSSSLSPEKFVKLFSLYAEYYSLTKAVCEFEDLLIPFKDGTL